MWKGSLEVKKEEGHHPIIGARGCWAGICLGKKSYTLMLVRVLEQVRT